jgi:sialate O-acetylesterase
MSSARAETTVASIFGDHMVLQRDMATPVWGRAKPGQKVILTFAGQTRETAADKDGRWLLRLGPMPADKKGQELRIEGDATVVLKDVLIGDVWLCSGQSNMAYPYELMQKNLKTKLEPAAMPLLRMFGGEVRQSMVPLESLGRAKWHVCNQPGGSAVAYFFGSEIVRLFRATAQLGEI